MLYCRRGLESPSMGKPEGRFDSDLPLHASGGPARGARLAVPWSREGYTPMSHPCLSMPMRRSRLRMCASALLGPLLGAPLLLLMSACAPTTALPRRPGTLQWRVPITDTPYATRVARG